MRTILAFLIVISLSGCGLEILTTTAIQGELAAQNASVAARALDKAKETTGEGNAQHAIDLYKAEKGENPPSLEALVPQFLAEVPVHPDGTPYGYDPTTGTLLEKPATVAAAAPAPSGDDWKTLGEVNAAVQRFGKDTGMYPSSLYALVPTYLPAVPKTASGQDFVYDPQYGVAYLPQAGATAPVAAPGAVSRGAVPQGSGPMGEAMTGIAISNQLDSMSNAGASAAQGRAGSSLGASQDLHNQQQEKMLQELGQ